MPSNTQPRRALVWLVVLALSLPALVQAGEAAGPGDEAAAPAPQTHAVNGLTITWDLDAQRYRAPSAAEAARIAAEFNRMMAERFAHGEGALAPAGSEIEVRTLASGAKMARLPVHLLNASLVRVDAAGQPRNLCVDSPVQAGTALSVPATYPVEEK